MNMSSNTDWKQVATKLLTALGILTVTYFALMALYFSAEFQKPSYLKNLTVLVVDLDHSVIGNHFLSFAQNDSLNGGQITWSVQTSYTNISSVIHDVDNGKYWGAMVVQPNASLNLNRALSVPLKDYDPTKAFLFIYDGGRDPLTVRPYIVASMYTQFLQFSKFFNPSWIKFVLQFADENNATLTPLVDAPQVLGTPVAFEEMDLHPPTAIIVTSATTVAYIWIFMVAGGSTYLVAHVVKPLTRIASIRKTMVLLLVPLLVFLASLSVAYTALLGLFGVPFDSIGQFMSLFGSMFLLQAAVASLVLFLIFLIPVTYISPFTVTFVVMNVIAVFNPVDLMPAFYRWVYAMPFLNAVQMARYILMGSYKRLEFNLPILFAWIIVPMTLLPFAIARQKRMLKEVQDLDRQQSGMEMDAYHCQQQQHSWQCLEGCLHQQQQRRRQGATSSDREKDTSCTTGDVHDSIVSTQKQRKRARGQMCSSHKQASESSASSWDSREHDASSYGNSDLDVDDRDIVDSDACDDNTAWNDVASSTEETYKNGGGRDCLNSYHKSMHHSFPAHPPVVLHNLEGRLQTSTTAPSAPPEAQVFGTVCGDGGVFRATDVQLHDGASTIRPIIDIPNLQRHPYASELLSPPSRHNEIK
ncbi:hypothetical protein BGZ94_004027 [Podila epigama]|nr:hypothetical protein BGZ94_004027 [Podila epigama]